MLAFSIDYYGIFFRATQSVELFCTYDSIKKNSEKQIHVGKKHTKKEYPTNCIEDILFGFFSLFI